MTLQQVIARLTAKAAEYKVMADAKTVDSQGHESARWAFAEDALLEMAEEFTLALAAEEKGHQQQIEEQRIAQHRAHQEYSND